MKYSVRMKIYGALYRSLIPELSRGEKKEIAREYRAILERAGDIGQKNNLLSSYTLCAFFIALNRHTAGSPEENQQRLARGMAKSRLLKMALGDAEGYLAPKRMAGRQEWSRQTHLHTYPDDWVVDILPAEGKYVLGYDYLECGCCKLCAHEGCPELTKYLCKLDDLLFDLIGLGLDRTRTLAEGGSKCDFRMYRR